MKSLDNLDRTIALHQMCSGINVEDNVKAMQKAIGSAAQLGACLYFAPEMSVLIDRQRQRAAAALFTESQTGAIFQICRAAAEAGIWVHLGSLAVRCDDNGELLANRTIVIDAKGQIRARYDKIHLFDVDLDSGESWRESTAFASGKQAVIVDTPIGAMGLSICYDMRFADLYSRLSRAGADVFAVPSAFTKPTGRAHWHIMLRARAIENAAFVIAAAQSGHHADGRETFGHSLVIDPWGEILLDLGEGEQLGYAKINLARITEVRQQIAVHRNRRDIPADVTRL